VAAALACTSAAAQEPERRCMEHHLREAIALNRERMPLYAAETGGRSRGVSRRLIRSERLGLIAAWSIDRRAKPWLDRGVRVVCDDFVPMAWTPPFARRSGDPPPSLAEYAEPDVGAIRRDARRALRSGGFPAASVVLERELDALAGTPAFHCMVRHLLESALRVANLAPRHAERARTVGMDSPERISRTLVDLHLHALGEAAALDRAAAPLQAEGVPIVCRDVPPIPSE
jgi:hypothetical protein